MQCVQKESSQLGLDEIKMIEKFSEKTKILHNIGDDIDKNNKSRPRAYILLHPKKAKAKRFGQKVPRKFFKNSLRISQNSRS